MIQLGACVFRCDQARVNYLGSELLILGYKGITSPALDGELQARSPLAVLSASAFSNTFVGDGK